MKKRSMILVIGGFITIYSCQKSETAKVAISNSIDGSRFVLPPPFTQRSTSGGTDMTFTYISKTYSEAHYKIYMQRVSDGGYVGTIYQDIVSTDAASGVTNQINRKTFSGTMVIRTNGVIAERWTYNKGLLIERYSNPEGLTTPQAEFADNPCTLRTIHNCVAQTIDHMGFFEYAACCIGADVCYPALWLDCIFDLC